MTDTEPPVDPDADAAGEVRIRTFLIADVRGYTLFTQERDEAAAKLAAKFADIVREVVEARGARSSSSRGDEGLCVFSSAREAIRALGPIRRSARAWTSSPPRSRTWPRSA